MLAWVTPARTQSAPKGQGRHRSETVSQSVRAYKPGLQAQASTCSVRTDDMATEPFGGTGSRDDGLSVTSVVELGSQAEQEVAPGKVETVLAAQKAQNAAPLTIESVPLPLLWFVAGQVLFMTDKGADTGGE